MSGTVSALDAFWQQSATQQLCEQLTQRFSAQQQFLVACSGGRDSLALARALHLLRPDHVRVIHINHQLQAPAAQWAHDVLAQCQQWQLPCTVQAVEVAQGNLEQQARHARYQALFAELSENEVLVLGHHQQDQAETVLLRVMSGSGVVGLSAMRAYEQRGQHQLWRPWLSVSRQDITQLASLICPSFVDDPANADLRFDRVILRQHIWPILSQRWAGFERGMARSAMLMQDAADILQDVLHIDWQACVQAGVLQLDAYQQLSAPRQRWLLSKWMQQDAHYAPPLHLVQRVGQELIAAKCDATPRVDWAQWQFRRYQRQLYRLPQQLELAENAQITMHIDDVLSLASGEWRIAPQQLGLSRQLLEQPWQLLARQGGEVLHLQGAVGRRTLKKTLQELLLAPWQREQVHILHIHQTVYGVFTAQGFLLSADVALVADGWLPCRLPI